MATSDPTPARIPSAPAEPLPDRAGCSPQPPPPSAGAGEPGEAAWQALTLRVAAERRRLAEGRASDLEESLRALRALLAAGPSAALVGPAALALHDELAQLVDALAQTVEATRRELVELDRQRRALSAYAARAGGTQR